MTSLRRISLPQLVLAAALAVVLLSLSPLSAAGAVRGAHAPTRARHAVRCVPLRGPGSRRAVRAPSRGRRSRLCARTRTASPATPSSSPAGQAQGPRPPAEHEQAPSAPVSSTEEGVASAAPIGEAADAESNPNVKAGEGEVEPEEGSEPELGGPHPDALASSEREAGSLAMPASVVQSPAGAPLAQSTAVGWGPNSKGELGGGFIGEIWGPMAMVGIGAVRQVVATYHSTFILLSSGTVLALGGNIYGQLGDGTHVNAATPVTVTGLTGVTQIAAGGAHALALLSNGTVETWGSDMYGELGNATTGAGHERGGSDVPVAVPGLSGVVAIAAGGADDAALLGNGTVMAWGENKSGQLGDGTMTEKDVPTLVRGLSGVRSLALGGIGSLGGHMLALLGNGTVMAAGANGAGQLGSAGAAAYSKVVVPVRGLSGVVAVSASISHSLALTSDGSAWAWGSDAYGELGVPGPVETCEAGTCNRVPLRLALSHVSAISAGFRFSLAISSGTPFSWGWNDAGQLGDGTRTSRSTPASIPQLTGASAISAGEYHSVALVGGTPPLAPVALAAGPGSLTISWRPPQATLAWTLALRPVSSSTVTWTQVWLLPALARTYTIPSLTPGQRYEVLLRSTGFGSTVVAGTPAAR